ncbi:hypothetical protein An01g04160 [Aspergillus niger]|uniref:Uncharacterized protein n=2 Tax=Aspergillus niger TaxID=5061 RepID=A2Q8F5_ASPNC|nr:hypothetical protein An01g04160 [Aspergillus niger]CAK36952.1 hypothetical protein An01g04160 [Aspergillus niger]
MGGGQLIIKMRLRPPLEPLKNVKVKYELLGAISCTFGDPPPITGRLDIVRPVTAGTVASAQEAGPPSSTARYLAQSDQHGVCVLRPPDWPRNPSALQTKSICILLVLRYCISQVQGSAIGIPASRDSERLLHSSPEPKNGTPWLTVAVILNFWISIGTERGNAIRTTPTMRNAKILRDRLSIHHGLVQLSNPEYPAR